MLRRDEWRDHGWRAIVANLWDWVFPRSCWAETACWMMGYEGERLRREATRGPRGEYCPDAANDPDGVGCWCGKFCPRADLKVRESPTEVAP